MELNIQNLIYLIGLVGSAFAIYKDWRKSQQEENERKLKERQQNRGELQADYERKKEECADLLVRIDKLETEREFLQAQNNELNLKNSNLRDQLEKTRGE